MNTVEISARVHPNSSSGGRMKILHEQAAPRARFIEGPPRHATRSPSPFVTLFHGLSTAAARGTPRDVALKVDPPVLPSPNCDDGLDSVKCFTVWNFFQAPMGIVGLRVKAFTESPESTRMLNTLKLMVIRRSE